MTDQEWEAETDPRHLLEALQLLRRRLPLRRLLLFGCACGRWIWPELRDPRSRAAVEVAEEHADGRTGPAALEAAHDAARLASLEAGNRLAFALMPSTQEVDRVAARANAAEVVRILASDPSTFDPVRLLQIADTVRLVVMARAEFPRQGAFVPFIKAELTRLIRCAFGNLFRPVRFSPSWLTPPVVALARSAYAERQLPRGTLDPARLAVLADALEEVGCDERELLEHLRGPGPHARGCFALELFTESFQLLNVQREEDTIQAVLPIVTTVWPVYHHPLEQDFWRLYQSGATVVRLDLRPVQYMDGHFVRLVLKLAKSLRAAGRRFVVLASPGVEEVFRTISYPRRSL